METKRCSIYVYWNAFGRLETYAIVAIKSLMAISGRVIVVVNGKFTSDARRIVTDELGVELIVRENEGYDFTAYKCGINYIGYNNFESIDELVILNSSVYGPIKSLSRCFEMMESRKDIDFWGMTKNKQGFPEHIQSYFFVFKNKLLVDYSFKDFWESLPTLQNREDAIKFGEVRLTQFLYNRGFNYDTVLERNYDLHGSPVADGAYYSLKDTIFPFVKRNLFTEAYNHLWYTSSPDIARRTFDLLSDEWKDIILDDLLNNQKQSIWKLALKNSWIIDDSMGQSTEVAIPSCAAIFFVWFEDNIDLIVKHILMLPKTCDIYIVSPKQSILVEYENKLKEEIDRVIVYRTQPNRGRNEACYWVCCRDVIKSHECICLIHDKKIAHLKPFQHGTSFFEYQLENLLHSESYISELLNKLSKNKRVGLVQPPLPVFGPWAGINVLYPPADPNNLSGNTERYKKFLGLTLPLDPYLPYPVGGSFWIRSDAFKLLLDKQLTYEDFPEEPLPTDNTFNHALERLYPLIAQQAGFMTVDAMTTSYSISHKGNLELYIRLNQKIDTKTNVKDGHLYASYRWKKIFEIFKCKLKSSIKKKFRKIS